MSTTASTNSCYGTSKMQHNDECEPRCELATSTRTDLATPTTCKTVDTPSTCPCAEACDI